MGGNKRLHFEVAVIKAIKREQVTERGIEERGIADENTAPPLRRALTRLARRGDPSEKKKRKGRSAPPGDNTREESIPPAGFKTYHEAVLKAVEQIRTRRPLIRGWVESAKALGIEGRFLVLGFPPEQKTAMESVANPRTRDFLEALIKEISGQDLKLKFTLKEGLPVAPVPEPAAAPDEAPHEKRATRKRCSRISANRKR